MTHIEGGLARLAAAVMDTKIHTHWSECGCLDVREFQAKLSALTVSRLAAVVAQARTIGHEPLCEFFSSGTDDPSSDQCDCALGAALRALDEQGDAE